MEITVNDFLLDNEEEVNGVCEMCEIEGKFIREKNDINSKWICLDCCEKFLW